LRLWPFLLWCEPRSLLLRKMCSNNALSFQCCATICTNNGNRGYHCWATMVTGHTGCPPRSKSAKDRQTDMYGPIRCSSLTLEGEEHLKATIWASHTERQCG
jgi:hypothetical protein